MGLVLLRYGEIALKGQNRTYFFRRLRRNIRLCLKTNGIEGLVWQEGQRLYLETNEVERAVECASRVFGLVSLSPARETPPDIDAISREAVTAARRTGLDSSRSFRVRARRSDKSFPHISPDIERLVGASVVQATGSRVDLSAAADLDIGVEVHATRALIFTDTVAGPGGLPLATQGKVIALLSSGIDSPVAIWLMMKRGCAVIPVHFSINPAQSAQVESIISSLNRYSHGYTLRPIVLSHQEALVPTLDRLRAARGERWACLFCKRTMLAKAADIAEEMDASALVTGDSLGQVASQTLSNIEVISDGIRKPILRPLIGFDKTEIMRLAREIGTYDVSTSSSHACPFLPDKPLTQASLSKLRDLVERMASAEPAAAAVDSSASERRQSHA